MRGTQFSCSTGMQIRSHIDRRKRSPQADETFYAFIAPRKKEEVVRETENTLKKVI